MIFLISMQPPTREVRRLQPEDFSLKEALRQCPNAAKVNLTATKEELRDLKVGLRQLDLLLKDQSTDGSDQDMFKVGRVMAACLHCPSMLLVVCSLYTQSMASLCAAAGSQNYVVCLSPNLYCIFTSIFMPSKRYVQIGMHRRIHTVLYLVSSI